jgi:hypothetical protein
MVYESKVCASEKLSIFLYLLFFHFISILSPHSEIILSVDFTGVSYQWHYPERT